MATMDTSHYDPQNKDTDIFAYTDARTNGTYAADVLSMTTETPPSSPSPGHRYIVPAGATGAWAAQNPKIATWSSSWTFSTPVEGLRVLVNDQDGHAVYRNGGWLFEDARPIMPIASFNVLRIARSASAFRGDLIDLADLGVRAGGSLDAYGDDCFDNTKALEDIFGSNSITDKTLRLSGGVYGLKYLHIKNMQRLKVIGDGAIFYGISQSEQDSIVRFHNVSRSRFSGFRVTTDGNRKDGDRIAPIYQPNYKCLVHITSNTKIWKSDWISGINYSRNELVKRGNIYYYAKISPEHHSDPSNEPGVGVSWETAWQELPHDAASTAEWAGSLVSSNNVFEDWELSMHPKGLVYGAHEADPPLPQQREGQDVNLMQNWTFRSVMKPFFASGENMGCDFVNPSVTMYAFSALRAPWWDDDDRIMWHNDTISNRLRIVGGNYTMTSEGDDYPENKEYGFYGKEIETVGCTEEVSAPHFVTGDFRRSGVHRGWRGSVTEAAYKIKPDATGQLVLDRVESRRTTLASGTPVTSTTRFIDAVGNTGMDIVVTNSRLEDQPWDGPADKWAFMGGKSLSIRDTVFKNSGSDGSKQFLVDMSVNRVTNADTTGDSMQTTHASPNGGWITVSGTGVVKRVADTPPNGGACAIELSHTGAPTSVRRAEPPASGSTRARTMFSRHG